MVTKFEALHQMAHDEALDAPLATRPVVYFTPGTEHLAGVTILDFDMIHDLVRPFTTADRLGALALRLLPRSGGFRYTAGRFYNAPMIVDGQSHYPLIDVMIDPRRPDNKSINSTLRHELRHGAQPDKIGEYNSQDVIDTVRTMAGYTAGMMAEVATQHHNTFGISAAILGCVGGLVATKKGAWELMQHISYQEIDANVFAWRHRAVQPLKIG
jgi:hypothetical protein